MKAWTVAVLSSSASHGQQIHTTFHLAKTHAEALGAGVRTAAQGHNCQMHILTAHACEVDPAVIGEAASALKTAERD